MKNKYGPIDSVEQETIVGKSELSEQYIFRPFFRYIPLCLVVVVVVVVVDVVNKYANSS